LLSNQLNLCQKSNMSSHPRLKVSAEKLPHQGAIGREYSKAMRYTGHAINGVVGNINETLQGKLSEVTKSFAL